MIELEQGFKPVSDGLRARQKFVTMRKNGEFVFSAGIIDMLRLKAGERFSVDVNKPNRQIRLTPIVSEKYTSPDGLIQIAKHSARKTMGGNRRVYFRSPKLHGTLLISRTTHRGRATIDAEARTIIFYYMSGV